MLVIIDYKVGNLGSIQNMFQKIGMSSQVSDDIADIKKASLLVLPGIGRFDFAKKAFDQSGLTSLVEERVFQDKVPILGICVGLQLMTKKSEEGDCEGLCWLDAEVKKFNFDHLPATDGNSNSKSGAKLSIPHMGWNQIQIKKSSALMDSFQAEQQQARFYFAQSYYVQSHCQEEVLATTNYGFEYSSALAKDNIFGVQFHPEKSHKYGMQLFKNFSLMDLNYAQKQAAGHTASYNF